MAAFFILPIIYFDIPRAAVSYTHLAYVLAKAGGLHLVWWSFPIAEIFSVFMSALFIRYVYKKEIAPLEN